MTKEEIQAEVDRCFAMSEAELEAHLLEQLNRHPDAVDKVGEMLDFIAESLNNGTLEPKP